MMHYENQSTLYTASRHLRMLRLPSSRRPYGLLKLCERYRVIIAGEDPQEDQIHNHKMCTRDFRLSTQQLICYRIAVFF